MVLVDYSDSESETSEVSLECRPTTQTTILSPPSNLRKRKSESTTDADPNTATERRQPPPLPSSFHGLYATNVRRSTSDDPSLHGGRKRQVVHVQGNWPSHIYLEWLPDQAELHHLDDIVSQVELLAIGAIAGAPAKNSSLKLNSLLRSSLSVQLPLHISLSAPLTLETVRKDAFRDAVTNTILASEIGPITIRSVSLDLVPNFERSRWFLVLRAHETGGTDKLKRLLQTCNESCEAFGLPILYDRGKGIGVEVGLPEAGAQTQLRQSNVQEADDGSNVHSNDDETSAFHVSIAWTLQGASQEMRDALRQIDISGVSGTDVVFDRVKVKIGNVIDDLLL